MEHKQIEASGQSFLTQPFQPQFPSPDISFTKYFTSELLTIIPIMSSKSFNQILIDAPRNNPVYDCIVSLSRLYRHQASQYDYYWHAERFVTENTNDKIRCLLLEALIYGLQTLSALAIDKCDEASTLLLQLPVSSYQDDTDLCMLFWSNTILIR